MPIRKSPLPTAAALAARRNNALKSTGPKTMRGKARSSLNALKHGRYAIHLRRKLNEAGDRRGEALYARIEARMEEAFCSSGTPAPRTERYERQRRGLAGLVWCFAARNQAKRRPGPKTNLECLLESVSCDARDLSPRPVLIEDGRQRIGVIFWRQRRRMRPRGAGDCSFYDFWKRFRKAFPSALCQTASGEAGFGRVDCSEVESTDPGSVGAQPAGPHWAGSDWAEEWPPGWPDFDATDMGPAGFNGSIFGNLASLAGLGEWETGVRSRIFRLRRPNIWAQLRFGLDRDGVYSREVEAKGRRELKKLCLAGIPVSRCPSVLDESLVPDPSLIPYGFEREAWCASLHAVTRRVEPPGISPYLYSERDSSRRRSE